MNTKSKDKKCAICKPNQEMKQTWIKKIKAEMKLFPTKNVLTMDNSSVCNSCALTLKKLGVVIKAITPQKNSGNYQLTKM